MNNYLIYKITNPSGKIYIGVTNDFNRRKSEHKSDWLNRPQKIALHNSFSKYSFDEHIFEIYLTNLNKENAYKKEYELILEYNTTNSKIGLNSRSGGLGGNMIDWKSDKGILAKKKAKETNLKNYFEKWDIFLDEIVFLSKTHSIDEIAKILNKSSSALCLYLKRKKIKIPRKNKYDLNQIALEIENYVKANYTNKKIIELTGYSKGTICRAKLKLN